MYFTFKIPMYECVIITKVVEKTTDVSIYSNKVLKKAKLESFDEEPAWGEVLFIGDNKYYLILSKESFKDYNTFFHEIYHLTDEISSHRHIEDREARAYLQGFIGDKIFKKLKTLFV